MNIKIKLRKNNRLCRLGAIALSADAADFLNNFDIIAQKPNTSTGFSGTLFRAKVDDPQSGLKAGQYFLSFRSTEFVDDYIRDSEGSNQSIVNHGWAFGQISDMETWYQELTKDDGPLPKDADLTVTGYSLGGHLATAFGMLREEDKSSSCILPSNISIYTFNGAGTGKLKWGETLHHVLEVLDGIYKDKVIPPEMYDVVDAVLGWRKIDSSYYNAQRLRNLTDEISNYTPSPDKPNTHPVIPAEGKNAFLDVYIHIAQYITGKLTGGAGLSSNIWP
ncbi:hypothetical protein FACS1894154_08240 [Betaproteobacteria bacterium]|nr:hypothetical protein FACS1894154_08240 [Betaproteobacteria bacterium]